LLRTRRPDRFFLHRLIGPASLAAAVPERLSTYEFKFTYYIVGTVVVLNVFLRNLQVLLVHGVVFFNPVVEGRAVDFVHGCILIFSLMISLDLLIELVLHETFRLGHLLALRVLQVLPLFFLLLQALPLYLTLTALNFCSLLVYQAFLTQLHSFHLSSLLARLDDSLTFLLHILIVHHLVIDKHIVLDLLIEVFGQDRGLQALVLVSV
jgi:hypothetical protein